MHIAKKSAHGSVTLFGGNLAATLIAAVTSIVVARLLGPPSFGVYSLSLAAPGLLQIFTDLGTRTAVTRYVAIHLSRGEADEARRYAQSSVLFAGLTGSLLTVMSYLTSGWVASTLFQRASLQPYIALASVGIMGYSLLLVGTAVATGRNAMGRASLLNVSQAAFKLVISLTLIVVGFGVGGAVLGHATSYTLAGGVAAALYVTTVRATSESLNEVADDAKEMVRFGFQPFVGSVLVALSSFYVSLLLAATANNSVIGDYQAAANLIVPATLLASAMATALYPAFSSLHGISADTGSALRISIRYVSYLVIPVLFFISASAGELMRLVYGESYSSGTHYLVLLPLAQLPLLLGTSVVPGFLSAIGRTRLTMFATAFGALGLFVTAPLFALGMGLGVVGLIYAQFVSNLVLAAVGLFLVRRYGLGNIGAQSAASILIASALSFVACWALPGFGPSFEGAILSFVPKLGVFALTYLTLAPLLGAVGIEDVDRIYESLSEVALLGAVLLPFSKFERSMASFVRRRSRPRRTARSEGSS